MASQPIILSDPRMLAEFLRQSEFQSFFEKRFAVPPDYAALLFKNGELIDAFKGGHFSVGGLSHHLKGLIGGSSHVSMMIADLKPFTTQIAFKATSKDKIEIAGVATLEMQVDPEKPSNLLGMMQGVARGPDKDKKTVGRLALSKADITERIRPHFNDRVFEAAIGRMMAADIRGDVGFQDKIQADLLLEVERVIGDLGLIVRTTSVEWATNKQEVEEHARAEAERRQEEMDFQFEHLKREAERFQDAAEFEIKANLEKARLENATEDELKHMALQSEISFIDAREDAKRRQELAELDHQISYLQKERKATFDNAIANAQHGLALREIEQRETKLDVQIAAIREQHALQVKKSGAFTEAEITERIQRQQRTHIAELQEIELRGEKLRSEIKRAEKKDDHAHQREIYGIQKGMTPEQILAINAGLSSDVATVLIEQARAKSSANEDVVALMREMVDAATASQIRSEEQALAMFSKGMEGATGVAHGAGGKGAGGNGAGGRATDGGGAPAQSASAAVVDCPKCGTSNPAVSNFCKKCGHKLRNA